MNGNKKEPLTAGTVSGRQKGRCRSTQSHYSTKAEGLKRIAAAVMALFILMGWTTSRAEEMRVKAWILCQPKDYINVREKASKKSSVVGRLDPGDDVETDGVSRGGFCHVYGGFEQADAWIFAGYVTEEEPEWIDREGTIVSPYRVACRKYIDGPRRRWVYGGDTVRVYWKTATWCVTNRGFIKTEYILLQAEEAA